jgi:hypothetical protein
MTIETIDNVQYYVWRAGDELPKYQPIRCEIRGGRYNGYNTDILPKIWDGLYDMVIWPKLLNDRAQHQRMIDEAFETALDHDSYAQIQRHNQLAYMHTQSGNKEYALDHLAKAGAYVKRMMEYVQEQIDKEVAE